ncbi:MAG: hypothetical protein OEZ33_08760 [Gammaproteobacteria bacterium]|nr:hypothetical protein [Gammaproteobacteria bacterium]
MNLHNSYFSIKNPLELIDSWLHPFCYKKELIYNNKKLQISWTQRAEHEFNKRKTPLFVEMQIYFSCVVQKRVLFHEDAGQHGQPVNKHFSISLRPVQAKSCDPEEFNQHHPVSHDYTSPAAQKLRPSSLQLDFKNNEWRGEFTI